MAGGIGCQEEDKLSDLRGNGRFSFTQRNLAFRILNWKLDALFWKYVRKAGMVSREIERHYRSVFDLLFSRLDPAPLLYCSQML